MKTLEELIQEIKESMVHKCNKFCRGPIHTGGGNYNKLSDIPPSMDQAILEAAQLKMHADKDKKDKESK